jgi:hypothetical protein
VTAAPVFLARCRYCSQPRHPREFIGDFRVGFCLQCYERHQKAIAALSGEEPKECPACRTSLESLIARGDTRMRIYLRDGIYQLLCVACGDAYEQKRADQFRNTPYGRAKGI